MLIYYQFVILPGNICFPTDLDFVAGIKAGQVFRVRRVVGATRSNKVRH